jgi:hypothetical protein
VLKGTRDALRELARVFETVSPTAQRDAALHRRAIDTIRQAATGAAWTNVLELETQFLDPDFDVAIVRASRLLLSAYLQSNPNLQLGDGQSVRDTISRNWR